MGEYSAEQHVEAIIGTSLRGWASELCIASCKRVAVCRTRLVQAMEAQNTTPASMDEPSPLYNAMKDLTQLHNHLNANGVCSGPSENGDCIQQLDSTE